MPKAKTKKLHCDSSSAFEVVDNARNDSPLIFHTPDDDDDDVHPGTAQPDRYLLILIEELRKISSIVPPNKVMPRSDYIPFPPDWTGPIPKCQQHLYKKEGNIWKRTMSFLSGRPSTSHQEPSATYPPYVPNPFMYVFVPPPPPPNEDVVAPVERSSEMYFFPEREPVGTLVVPRREEAMGQPSTSHQVVSSEAGIPMEDSGEDIFDSELLNILNSMEE